MADIPGYPARRAALQMVDAVLHRGETLDHAMRSALRNLRGAADRGLARALAGEVLRWLQDLDDLIDSATQKNLPDDAKARSVLRIMLAGWLRLDTPPHAVISTALPLLNGGPRRLAHGVFSALIKRPDIALPAAPTLPDRVMMRWDYMPAELLEDIEAGLAVPPPLDIMLKHPSRTQEMVKKMAAEMAAEIGAYGAKSASKDVSKDVGSAGSAQGSEDGVQENAAQSTQRSAPIRAEALGVISLAEGHIRLPRGSLVENLPGFAEGDWWVQDLAATLPGRLLRDGPIAVEDQGEGGGNGGNSKRRKALDLCAAPGGKTMQLAAAGWDVTALDISARRIEKLDENLKRTGLKAQIVKANALEWEPSERFDAILLDAPCSASGTCRRHPDVLHRVTHDQIQVMSKLQGDLLERAANWLNPGGILIYAVCSLERAEGEAQAEKLALKPLPIEASELPQGLQPAANGWLRTHPGMLKEQGGLDGFFIARWRK